MVIYLDTDTESRDPNTAKLSVMSDEVSIIADPMMVSSARAEIRIDDENERMTIFSDREDFLRLAAACLAAADSLR